MFNHDAEALIDRLALVSCTAPAGTCSRACPGCRATAMRNIHVAGGMPDCYWKIDPFAQSLTDHEFSNIAAPNSWDGARILINRLYATARRYRRDRDAAEKDLAERAVNNPTNEAYTVAVGSVPNRTDGLISIHVGGTYVLLSREEADRLMAAIGRAQIPVAPATATPAASTADATSSVPQEQGAVKRPPNT